MDTLFEGLEQDEVGDEYPYEEALFCAPGVKQQYALYKEELPEMEIISDGKKGGTPDAALMWEVNVDHEVSTEQTCMSHAALMSTKNAFELIAADMKPPGPELPPPPDPSLIGQTEFSLQLKENIRRAKLSKEKREVEALRQTIFKEGQVSQGRYLRIKQTLGLVPSARRLARRFRHRPYTRYLVSLARAKFAAAGVPKRTAATQEAISSFLRREMLDHKVRAAHMNEVLPNCVELVFTPTRAMLTARRLALAPEMAARRHEALNGPTYMLSTRLWHVWTGKGTSPSHVVA